MDHEFLGGELALADLVTENEMPYQTQDKLQVTIHDIFWT